MICVRCDKDGFSPDELAAHVAVCGKEPVPTVMTGSKPVDDEGPQADDDHAPSGGSEDIDDGLPSVPGPQADDEKSALIAEAIRLGVINPDTDKPATAPALGRWGVARLQAAIADLKSL